MAKTKSPESAADAAQDGVHEQRDLHEPVPEPPPPVVAGDEGRAEAQRFIEQAQLAEPVRVVMTRDVAAKLRAPFKPEQIGLLPKPTNKDNQKGTCDVCGKYHGLPAVHLDYVGHAAATDRLLQVDPNWTWRPMAVDPNGHPIFDTSGGLWILLTVAGVTRPGYGDSQGGKGSKEVIGDALRNAAMRFGVALDLWSKEDLHASGDVSEQAVGEVGDLRAYDPAAGLVPGAPAGWQPIMEGLRELDPSLDWVAVIQSAFEQGYGVQTRIELGDQEQEAGTRIANAVALMASEHPPGQMPPITDTEIQEAFGWAFGGDGSVLVTIPEADAGALGGDTTPPAPTEGEGDEPAAD